MHSPVRAICIEHRPQFHLVRRGVFEPEDSQGINHKGLSMEALKCVGLLLIFASAVITAVFVKAEHDLPGED
jgi:hypothetical protein